MSGEPRSVASDLVCLSRDGCVGTRDMVSNLDLALRSLGWPTDYSYIDISELPRTDARTGYPTPTILWKTEDIFGMATPTPAFAEAS